MSNDTTTTATTAVALSANPDGLRAIVMSTPSSFKDNKMSRDNCIAAGTLLLDSIRLYGMNDDIDCKVAAYIDKTRRTIKAMNERRAPVTKLFDRIRGEFTAMENDIDPLKPETVAYTLQQHRNAYAAKKHEAEEARRRAEEAARQEQLARVSYRAACIDDYKLKFNEHVVKALNIITELNANVTVDNYSTVFDTVSAIDTELSGDWHPESSVRMPYNLAAEESRTIRDEAFASLLPQFKEQFRFEVSEYRQDTLDKLPSKLAELQRMAKASADEAECIAAELKARDEAEQARQEQQRALREAEQARQKDVEKATSEAASLFSLSAAQSTGYTPKTKVSKKIKMVTPEGYMQCFAMWWSREGCHLTPDELAKLFKKQVAFCEKLANKDGEFIESPAITYVDNVKAL